MTACSKCIGSRDSSTFHSAPASGRALPPGLPAPPVAQQTIQLSMLECKPHNILTHCALLTDMRSPFASHMPPLVLVMSQLAGPVGCMQIGRANCCLRSPLDGLGDSRAALASESTLSVRLCLPSPCRPAAPGADQLKTMQPAKRHNGADDGACRACDHVSAPSPSNRALLQVQPVQSCIEPPLNSCRHSPGAGVSGEPALVGRWLRTASGWV